MVEFSVVLERFDGSSRPDVCIFRDEDRRAAVREMRKYCVNNGFTVYDKDGRFTIKNIALIEKEPVVGAPVISKMSYLDIFDIYNNEKPVFTGAPAFPSSVSPSASEDC